MPSAVVMPRPSWPAAIQSPSTAGQAPMSGSLSGVAGRNPVQVRSAVRRESPGMNRNARSSMRESTPRLMEASHPTSSREEPISNWPVTRGWTLKATDAADMVWALCR